MVKTWTVFFTNIFINLYLFIQQTNCDGKIKKLNLSLKNVHVMMHVMTKSAPYTHSHTLINYISPIYGWEEIILCDSTRNQIIYIFF